ncbi:MAG: hypothetical protein RSE13_12010 [Planktothrix sp. GU0601_MAG3]|nr:MAG: hypothetical protein RSE13_12010 [Planktothrix sp. GU0601_MAG3]
MSVCRNSVLVFIELIEKPNSISLADWQDLQQWVNNIPTDEEDIVDKIEAWLKLESRQQIYQEYRQRLKETSPSLNLNLNLAIGNPKYSSPLDPNSTPSSQLLINSIIKLSIPIVPPETSSKPKNPQDSNPQP